MAVDAAAALMFDDACAADHQLAQVAMFDSAAPRPHFVADLEALFTTGQLPEPEAGAEDADVPLVPAQPAGQRRRTGLAEEVKQGRWAPDPTAETDLDELAAHVAFANRVVT